MKKGTSMHPDEMRTEYVLSDGAKTLISKGSPKVRIWYLSSRIFKAFPSGESVNRALRILVKAGAEAVKSKSDKQVKAS